MKTLRIAVAVVSLGLQLPLASHAAGIPAPKVEKLNERVYALLGPMGFPSKQNHGYMVNSTIIIGDKGVILVDTGFTDKIGKHLAAQIKKITNKPVTHIINTHHHGDHTLGNIAFKGAEVISSEQCREMLDNTALEWVGIVESMTGMKFPNTKPVLASKTYAESTRNEITLQGVKLVLWVPNRSHTSGDLLVYLPDDKVLLAGDVLVNETMPQFRDAYVKSWAGTLKEIQQLDITTIVPGHGPLMSKPQAAKLATMMARFYDGVEAGYKKGLTDSEVRQTLDLTEWKKLKEFEETMGANLNRTYLEVEQSSF